MATSTSTDAAADETLNAACPTRQQQQFGQQQWGQKWLQTTKSNDLTTAATSFIEGEGVLRLSGASCG